MANQDVNTGKETENIKLSTSKAESSLYPPELPKCDYPPMPMPKSRKQKSPKSNSDTADELTYLPPPMPAQFYEQEGVKQKMIRKTKENPFVPLGALVTALVLVKGLTTMSKGAKPEIQNYWMRMRVACQGFALLALIGGTVYQTSKKLFASKESSETV